MADPRDDAHNVALKLSTALGSDLVVIDSVAAEADSFIRRRAGARAGRTFHNALVRGEHTMAYLTPGLLVRAAELDAQYADLNLGLVDTALMAYAERHDLPILTFDFAHFRATESARGPWRLALSEEQLRRVL